MSTSYTAKGDEQGNALLPYKVYKALLTQSGTDAPVATVLQNTLGGDILYNYKILGIYEVTSASLFTNNKTVVLFSQNISNDIVDSCTIQATSITNSSFFINIFDANTQNQNDVLLNTLIEIQVYM